MVTASLSITLCRKPNLLGKKEMVIDLTGPTLLAVNIIDDFEKYMKVPNEWTPAELKPYNPGENLLKWLTDEKARDEFVIRAVLDGQLCSVVPSWNTFGNIT